MSSTKDSISTSARLADANSLELARRRLEEIRNREVRVKARMAILRRREVMVFIALALALLLSAGALFGLSKMDDQRINNRSQALMGRMLAGDASWRAALEQMISCAQARVRGNSGPLQYLRTEAAAVDEALAASVLQCALEQGPAVMERARAALFGSAAS